MTTSSSELTLVAAGDDRGSTTIAPCPDCDTLIETSDYCRWFLYNGKHGDDMIWEPTDKVVSHTRCDSCQAAVDERLTKEKAEWERNAAIARAKRAEIRRKIAASQPIERQIGFDGLVG